MLGGAVRRTAPPSIPGCQINGRFGYRAAIVVTLAMVALVPVCRVAEAQQSKPSDSPVEEVSTFNLRVAKNKLEEAKNRASQSKYKCKSSGAEEQIRLLERYVNAMGHWYVSDDLDLGTNASGFDQLYGRDFNAQLADVQALLVKLKALPPCKIHPKIRRPPSYSGKHAPAGQRQQIGRGFSTPPAAIPCSVETGQFCYAVGPSFTGPFLGVQFTGSWSSVGTREYLAATGMRTNAFDDTGSGFGGGVNFGYNWQPWQNNAVVGVIFDINGVNDRVRHDFAGGNYIGSVVNFTASALARGGVLITPSVLLYGQTGISIANQQLQIDFGGPETNESKVTPGFTVGFGAEWLVSALTGPAAKAPSVFIDFKQTWWDTPSLKTPVASPFFNYDWRRETESVTLGFRYRW
jgi:hypothetical protein